MPREDVPYPDECSAKCKAWKSWIENLISTKLATISGVSGDAASNIQLVAGEGMTINPISGTHQIEFISTGSGGDSKHAETADYATKAGTADKATEADHATKADEATRATNAYLATKATTADNATYATTAGSATKAETADKSTEADHATNADLATKADTAKNAEYATYADDAGELWDGSTGQTIGMSDIVTINDAQTITGAKTINTLNVPNRTDKTVPTNTNVLNAHDIMEVESVHNNLVHRTGNESILGVKVFTGEDQIIFNHTGFNSNTPTDGEEAINIKDNATVDMMRINQPWIMAPIAFTDMSEYPLAFLYCRIQDDQIQLVATLHNPSGDTVDFKLAYLPLM